MSTPVATEGCLPSATNAIGPEAAAALSDSLRALADPLRLRIVSAIAVDPRGECCVCDLSELAQVSQPTISHHLKVLKDSGMLLSERRGTWVYYRIAPARRRAAGALLDALAPAVVVDAAGDGNAPGVVGAHDTENAHEETLRAMDDRVSRLAEQLAAETTGIDRDLVVTIVRESYAGLVRSARLPQHLIPLTERFARQRLADLTRDRDAHAPQVLFVCVQNAGRSQLAAAIVNQLSGGTVVARSAGSAPATDVHPQVRSMLSEIEGEEAASAAFTKPLTDDAVRAADVVVTMGCGDVCPIIPGVRYEDWAVGDPALASSAGVEAIRGDIELRVRALLKTLVPDLKDPR